MKPIGGIEVRSMNYSHKNVDIGVQAYQLGEEFQMLMAGPPPTGNSFTALLELPANQAMELLHSPGAADSPTELPLKRHHNMSHRSARNHPHDCAPAFPSNAALNEGATKYSGISTAAAFGGGGQDSPESSSSANAMKVKSEPMDSGSSPNSLPHTSNPTVASKNEKHTKRKEREKGKATNKKNKTAANDNSKEGERLPYVHVRARRGQATNSHSLAERARREKINARMKLLQELVPGCSKISGTALVLDEIINHVHSLQRKVEFLSMRLAAVNPRIDFNLDSLFTAGNGSVLESNFPSMVMPLMWPDIQMLGNEQECQQQWHLGSVNQPVWTRQEGHQNLIISENSLLSYDSPANSVSLHSSQQKMEI
ncbi:hypothetical protein Nepgr_021967 [Nepenthes gracilis]|uniref:BHLH domain-containing protein n=1 Tax=Nepenthes gracilis TaxID=150966 RepID=A0AAD3SZW3_NEPGR|nr:hypothetical protein Nepgr_021967 [Nepenthes gracilis]